MILGDLVTSGVEISRGLLCHRWGPIIITRRRNEKQSITAAHMLDGLEGCRNVADQKTILIPISNIEVDFSK